MPVGLLAPSTLTAINGIRLSTACAGIKQTERADVSLIELAEGSHCAAVFTRNAFCAAPVTLSKQHLQHTAPRYWLINSGNANAGTGEQGLHDAQSCCQDVAHHAHCETQAVLPFSTGVIGENLPVEKIQTVLGDLYASLSPNNWLATAHAIMTTDTLAKGLSVSCKIQGQTITLTGICKGAGMIRPDMATMLAFIATDANIEQTTLQNCLTQASNLSFNRITIDGDTSTNDACMLAATARSKAIPLQADSPELAIFQQTLNQLCQTLAQSIVRDGEGATKFVTVQVEQGENPQECLDIAYTIAHSPLVKTALFASDPNWGRILAAVGRAGLKALDLNKIRIELGDVCIVSNGGRDPDYTEAQGQAVMNQADITIRVILQRGDATETLWTSDLSYDYVKINAEYRT